jgi:hypothetical protein
MTNEHNEHFLLPTPIPSSHALSFFLIKARITNERNESKAKKDDNTWIQYLNDKFQPPPPPPLPLPPYHALENP